MEELLARYGQLSERKGPAVDDLVNSPEALELFPQSRESESLMAALFAEDGQDAGRESCFNAVCIDPKIDGQSRQPSSD
jgi:hypothetical protein